MTTSRAGDNINSFNINSFNDSLVIDNVYIVDSPGGAEERAEILAWLSPLEPRTRHDGIRAHRVEHVGDWLLQTEEYRNWFRGIRGWGSDNSALFCYGDLGVGKTYIR